MVQSKLVLRLATLPHTFSRTPSRTLTPWPLSQTGPPPARERGKMRGKNATETFGKGGGVARASPSPRGWVGAAGGPLGEGIEG